MEKFTVHQGTAVSLVNDNIDTDQIIPKQFLKSIDKSGFGKNLFFEWRYLGDSYEKNPAFILNDPAYKGATILITGDNFGCGSSREHAAWAIGDYGFKAVVAGSFSDIFYNNALKNGILPIVLPQPARELLFKLLADEPLTIDLPNQLLKSPVGDFSFSIDATSKHKLVNGLDDIGITLTYEDEISNYEKQRWATYL